MTGEINNIHQRTNVTPVTLVGNSWVVCESKSRQGYKYYFNTLSGQSVWNLSPEEIEKAKKFTKGLPISEIEKCPEPTMDPPINPNFNPAQPGPSQMNNEPFVPISNPVPNMYPMGFLNGSNLPVHPGMSVQGLNPLIWGNPPNNSAIPPTQVIYVAVPQMGFQQTQAFTQNLQGYREPPDNRKRFYNNQGADNTLFSRSNRFETRGQNIYDKRKVPICPWINNTSDLRQKLRRKRSLSLSENKDSNYTENVQPMHSDDSYQKFCDRTKNMGVSSNSSQIGIEESPSKYDLSVLEQLRPLHSRAKHWFIVVDTEIILNNFSFLDKVTNPDQNCYLMVPHHVMKELQEIVSLRGDIQARRILRFLTQQIEAELASLGNEISIPENRDDTYKVLATCEELADQHNVILLSNDDTYQRHKNEHSNVHIMTINELKWMLIKQETLRPKSPTLEIKIIIPNTQKEKIMPPTQIKKSISLRSIASSTSIEEIQQPQSAPIILPSNTSEIQNQTGNGNIKTGPPQAGEREKLHVINEESESKASTKSAPVRLYRWRKSRNKTVESKQTVPESTKSRQDQRDVENGPDCNTETVGKESTPAPSISRSSVSSYRDVTQPDIVIEETSTSGVISNTTIGSDTVNQEIKKTGNDCDKVLLEMFPVGGESIEEVLRTRREEWVLRFYQIMEDALKESLRVDSPFQSQLYKYSAPWSEDLPYLVRYIITKFGDDWAVCDAGNRLSCLLRTITKPQGANIEPQQFMDMYSFGVYLLKCLKNVTEDCEDLNTALASLQRLLFDIQNADLETGHCDTFADEVHDTGEQNTAPPAHGIEIFQESTKEKESHRREMNTRSRRNAMTPGTQDMTPGTEDMTPGTEDMTPGTEDMTQIHKNQRKQKKIERTFFSSLALVKKPNPIIPPLTIDFPNSQSTPNTSSRPSPPSPAPPPGTPTKSPVLQISTSKELVNKNVLKGNSEIIPNEATSSPLTTCFIRHFNTIPQFEQKLSQKQVTVDGNLSDYEYDDPYHNDDEYYEDEIEYHENALEPETAPVEEEAENNEKFEWFIKEFTDEIKRTVKVVLSLCTNFVEECKNSNKPNEQIQEELRIACESMKSIKNALSSILDNDPTLPENNIPHLLKMANLDDFVPSEKLLLEYTDIIGKCRDHVNFCYDKITQIMQVAGI